MRATGARETSLNGRPAAEVVSNVTYRRDGTAIATGTGAVTIRPPDVQTPGPGRPMYRYSQAEIEDLVTRLDAEPPRLGDRPLCWADVSAGDALPELIKGPLSLGDLITWAIAEGTPIKAGNLVHKE